MRLSSAFQEVTPTNENCPRPPGEGGIASDAGEGNCYMSSSSSSFLLPGEKGANNYVGDHFFLHFFVARGAAAQVGYLQRHFAELQRPVAMRLRQVLRLIPFGTARAW